MLQVSRDFSHRRVDGRDHFALVFPDEIIVVCRNHVLLFKSRSGKVPDYLEELSARGEVPFGGILRGRHDIIVGICGRECGIVSFFKFLLAGLPDEKEFEADKNIDEKINGRQAAVLVVLFGTLAVQVYGLLVYQWYFEEMAGLFLAMGIVCGLIGGLSPSKIATTFTAGAKGLAGSALTLGFARAIMLTLENAMVIDTIANAVSIAVNALPAAVQSIGFFLAQTGVSFVITSGSGMAAVTIPLMAPVADLIGLSRQALVLAYQMGDGFSNLMLPTTSSLLGALAVSKIPYARWVKFMFPLFLIWTALGAVMMVLAVAVGY